MTTIILLNGVGSAGKGSIARALQEITREPYLHVQMDAFIEMLPASLMEHQDGISFAAVDGAERPTVAIRTGPAARRLLTGMHGAIAAMAAAGNNLIVDDVMLNDRIDEYRRLLSGFRLHVVGVFASLDVLEARERQRGDRTIGLARWQFDRVHGGIDYDLRLDTDKATPQECARRVRDRFAL